MKKVAFVAIGLLSLALGIIGIFLPILPTTPFLLLSAFCFTRSSKRLLIFLLTNRFFGKYISNYRNGLGIPLRTKIYTVSLLWITILFSIFFVVDEKFWLQILLACIAIGVTIHVSRIKTLKK
ncbi:MAG: YbaN family protein [Candidatus Kapabacteria bacterium]|nr:YbaN family protein [Candidatus Kapabacteria bacterium]